MALLNSVIFLAVIGIVMSYSFVPSSVYVIDSAGRIRRDINVEPLLRQRRNGGSSSSATAYSSASASSSSSSGSGGAPINFGGNGYVPNFADIGYDNFPQNLPAGAQIFSRFGEEEGTGVLASGSAQGPKGAFSSTSVTADDSGKVKYSVKSAKY